jgi:DNA-binding NtrC family response regulator
MKKGAHDYLAKPFEHHEVMRVVHRALAERELKRKLKNLSGQLLECHSLSKMMGPSDAIGRLIAEVNRVAKSDFTVIIQGETGAGKELVASAIHRASSRAEAPFIPVDCGAIPENLLETELFGHEKGSFTGADGQKIGKFELAKGGTLFLVPRPSCCGRFRKRKSTGSAAAGR